MNEPISRRALLTAVASAGVGASLAGVTRSVEAEETAHSSREPVSYFGAPDAQVPKVGLRWAFSATVFFADRIMINSPTPRGYTSVGGGEIWGPRLQGRVLPHSGADYFKTTFNTYYCFQASDGAIIFIHNRGTMRRFETPEPAHVRFRATPVFTAPSGPHEWMNRTVFVAHCQRQSNPDHTVFTYYEVL
ncbi:MAG TPA: DUF3237 domain-containing protein [Steroidobacteraceae bacterium]|nr:DUF3237 domain-containing protein [Steroidobacteraceae bacterium]